MGEPAGENCGIKRLMGTDKAAASVTWECGGVGPGRGPQAAQKGWARGRREEITHSKKFIKREE
jgi:hypothetical protein